MENMASQSIRCSIVNCHYWGQGNRCQATQILVTSDEMSNNLPDSIDAPMANQVTQTPVGKSAESCCKTFVNKQSFKQNMDGVVKK